MKTIIGLFDSARSAESAIEELRSVGVDNSDISYVGKKADGKIDTTEIEVNNTDGVASGATSGVVAGGLIGAIAGLVVANGILPGLGTLFVAGPLATALGLTGAAATTVAGAATGAAAGGLIGALSGLGVSETDARMYETRIKSGNIAVVTTIKDASTATSVENVFTSHGADEVHLYNT